MSNLLDNPVTDKLVHGYDTMMEKLYEWAEKSDDKAGPLLIHGLEDAAVFLNDLGEWTKEEIDLVSHFVKRDIHHIAQNLEKSNTELSEWLEIDKQKVESGFLAILSKMADQTRVELDHIKHLAETINDLHTGEVTSLGSISCKSCGKTLHFHQSGRIPPCPSCHKTIFERSDSGKS